MRKFIVGVAQINSRDDIHANLAKIEKMVEQLAKESAQVIIFPEYSSYTVEYGYQKIAQDLDGEIITKFKSLAKKHNVYIHNGSFIEKIKDNEKVHNTSVFINPKGEIEACYRKIHLFDINIKDGITHTESDEFLRGDEVVVTSNDLSDFGFSICYDIRFPELFRKLTLNGAKIIFAPAAFTMYTGKDHWESLLRARAIENQVYIVAPCKFGSYPPNNKKTFGNSMVIDPWGTVIARASERECCFTAEIDLDYLEHVRKVIPSLQNRVEINSK